MKTACQVLARTLCALILSSCGPLSSPMPVHLAVGEQAKIDEAWNNAFTPIDNHSHQELLDILVTTGAYEFGVDKISFRSSKRFKAGLVVMELQYNRFIPENDRFVIQILDGDGKILRQETYGRAEIENTQQELNQGFNTLRSKENAKTATALELKRLKQLEARYRIVERSFPKREETNDKNPKPPHS